MPYEAQISRTSPTAFLFLVDQSGSMSDKMISGRTKAEFVADVLNRTLMDLITRCTKSEGVRDYFEIGVLGYGQHGVTNSFKGELGQKVINPISLIEKFPLKIEDRKKKMDDGAGGVIEVPVKFPMWFEPVADGGTPMRAALIEAAQELSQWCDSHPDSYPPTILHVTDGESNDGDPEGIANDLCHISTNDGEILLLNLHVSTLSGAAIKFPSGEFNLPDSYAKMLFRMSSLLPSNLVNFAQGKGYSVSSESRGFMFNAEAAEIADFFEIGTRAAQLR